jgi:hypothetical protein
VTRDRDEAAAALEREAIGREPIPTRMSFRVEFNRISGNAPPGRHGATNRVRHTGRGCRRFTSRMNHSIDWSS